MKAMKKITILLVTCFYTLLSFGQLEVNTNGAVSVQNYLSVSDETTMYGEAFFNRGVTLKGINGFSNRGVLVVSSNGTHPEWNPILPDLLSLITAQSKGGEYAFVNYYNGVSNFRVGYDGSVYTKYGLIQSSDSLCKDNIAPLSPTLNKLQSLQGVSFNYKDNTDGGKEDSVSTRAAKLGPNAKMSDIQRQIESEKTRKRIGLIAQDVEKIYPEVVRTQVDGTKGILYTDLVAVLVEGIKELSGEVTGLKEQVATLQEKVEQLESGKVVHFAKQDNSKDSSKILKEAVLYQNTPNPFNRETQIAYRIPNDVTACINIYNLNGQELRSYPLSNSNGYISVAGSELSAGIYIYSLIINNQEVDSKRMVLTNN